MRGSTQEDLNIPGSTLSHHLSKLAQVHLIRQERQGTLLTCHPQLDVFQDLIGYLSATCCKEVDEDC